VQSITAGASWGFVVDKQAEGNIFRRCDALDVVGSKAAAAFVARGFANTFEECTASEVKTVISEDMYLEDSIRSYYYALERSEPGITANDVNWDYSADALAGNVSAGFLFDHGSADGQEVFRSNPYGCNTLKNCYVTNVTSIGCAQITRNAEILYRAWRASAPDISEKCFVVDNFEGSYKLLHMQVAGILQTGLGYDTADEDGQSCESEQNYQVVCNTRVENVCASGYNRYAADYLITKVSQNGRGRIRKCYRYTCNTDKNNGYEGPAPRDTSACTWDPQTAPLPKNDYLELKPKLFKRHPVPMDASDSD